MIITMANCKGYILFCSLNISRKWFHTGDSLQNHLNFGLWGLGELPSLQLTYALKLLVGVGGLLSFVGKPQGVPFRGTLLVAGSAY